MSDYTSGQISFAGLGNGTDFQSLIEGLVKVERQRIGTLETWKSSWTNKITEFQNLNTQLLDLKSTLEKYDTPNEFLTKSVTSSYTSILTASANADSMESTNMVEVGNLASNDVLITSNGVANLTDSVVSATSNFTYSYKGTSYTISNVAAGTSLSTLVNTINSHPDSRNNLRATTVYDGTTYHLQLSGKDQGADYQVVISNTGSMVFGASSFIETQGASNAKIRVNGYPPDSSQWIERTSNTIDDVIEGVTLNLKDAAVGTTVQLTTATDSSAVKSNIYKIVDQINTVRAKIQSLTKVETVNEKAKGSLLTGNYGVEVINQNLKNITAQKGLGFEFYDESTGQGDRYAALAHIGILTDAEEGSETYGLLKIDDVKLSEALAEDPNAVAELFSAHYEGESDTGDITYVSLIEGTTKAGSYDVQVVTSAAGISSATINGEPATVSGWSITGAAGTDAAGMSLRLDNHTGNSTFNGTINVKLGKTGEMVEELKELTKPYNKATHTGGPLAVLEDNYEDIIESIDKKIAYEEDRIERYERNLKLKYARLDALLGDYNNKQTALLQQIKQLGS